jgi:hypothetical protein
MNGGKILVKIYKKDCEICGNYYEGHSSHFCTSACRFSLKATQNRLMSKVKYEDNDCWTSLFKNRSIKHDGEYHSIFKIAYSLKNNIDLYDKEKAYVHICDNNMCINPSHLTITYEQNRNNYIFVSDKERFWSFVDKKNVNECWEWKGSKRKEKNKGVGNYGKFTIKSKDISAHRYSFILHFGEFPDDLHVCHFCDNPPCVNPKHLYLGTQKENIADKIQRGRGNFKIKYSEDFVNLLKEEIGEKERNKGNIRERNDKGKFFSNEKTYKEIGEKYGLTTSQTWRLINIPRKTVRSKNENSGY